MTKYSFLGVNDRQRSICVVFNLHLLKNFLLFTSVNTGIGVCLKRTISLVATALQQVFCCILEMSFHG
ncbi:hypothetical protein D3C85_1100680 [compost metagenome]